VTPNSLCSYLYVIFVAFILGTDTSNSSNDAAVVSVEAGYHRVAWRSTQDADTKELALRVVLILARYGTSQCDPLTL
jgi:hypothetical protein